MQTRVLKFGGSSVATVEKIQALANRIQKRQAEGFKLVIVVSAMGKSTNGLIDLANQISKSPKKREMDMLLSTGEQVSVSLMTMALDEIGVDAIGLTGAQAGILTHGLHTKNKINSIDPKRIVEQLNQNKVVVVAGFQGINELGDITTLGRGGSDTSAVALGAAIGCDVEIYTDVSGIYGIDPRIYPQAKQITEISYDEMKEMAFLGAKIMEPRSIEIGQRYGVNIYVGSAHSDEVGTWIKEKSHMEQKSVTGVTAIDDVVLVSVEAKVNKGLTAHLFKLLAENEVNVDVITQSITTDHYVSVSFTISKNDIVAVEKILNELKNEDNQIEYNLDTDNVKVSIVGEGMRTQTGVAANVFDLFLQEGIEFKLVSTSEISISYTMDKAFKEKAMVALAQDFNL